MSQPLDNFAHSAADWRQSLRINNRKTHIVISLFFLIYLSLGVLVDMYIGSQAYPYATLPQLFIAVLTFQIPPIATGVMLTVASVSLFITYSMSDQLMLMGTDYREITPKTAQTQEEAQLYNIIEELKIASSLNYMPKVYIIDADYMNAFASGYSEKSAMVAITRGLMQKLTRSEIQAVMAHEMSHVRHMDIKLTLMASVLANLILMVLDLFFYNALYSRRSNEEGRSRNSLIVIIMLLRYLLPVINVILLLYLSRTREYMADAGSVELLRDNQPLATALLKIAGDHEENKEAYQQAYTNTPHENVRKEAYIFDPVQAGIQASASISDLFSTHPNIRDRLAAIGFKSPI